MLTPLEYALAVGSGLLLLGNVALMGRLRRLEIKASGPVPSPVAAPLAAPVALPVVAAPVPVQPASVPLPARQDRRARIIRPEQAARELVACLHGYGRWGWIASSEIDEWWQTCAAEENIEPINPQLVREALAGLTGVRHISKKRIRGPEFIEVRRATGKDRCAVFWIPASLSRSCWDEAVKRQKNQPENADPDAAPDTPKATPARGTVLNRAVRGRMGVAAPRQADEGNDYSDFGTAGRGQAADHLPYQTRIAA